MRTALAIFISVAALLSVVSAQDDHRQGIMPGEPDPNGSPRSDRPEAKGCPPGMQRFEKFRCGTAEEDRKRLECENYRLVLECRKKAPPKPRCKKGELLIPEYACD